MKKYKKLGILGGVFLALCLCLFIVTGMEKKEENIKLQEEIILDIPYEEIEEVSWNTMVSDETLTFTKDENWTYTGDESFPVDEDIMKEALGMFSPLRCVFKIESPEDMSQYGFDNPAANINIKTSDKNYEIVLGDFSEMDMQRYALTGDGNVYLIPDDPFPRFDREYTEFIKNDDIPEMEEVISMSFECDEPFYMERYGEDKNSYREDDIYFTDIDGEKLPIDTELVNGYMSILKYINLDNFVTYNAGEEELAMYGLDDPELSFTIDYTSKNDDEEDVEGSFTMHISRDPKELEEIEKKASEETPEDTEEEEVITAYARVGDSPIVYKLIDSDYKRLMRYSYDEFRHKEIIPCEFDDIKEFEIELEGSSYLITSEIKDEERIYSFEDEQLDISRIRDAVNGIKAVDFVNEKPGEKKEIGLKITLDFEDEPVYYIDIYRFDGENCLVTIDKNSFALAERSKVVDLIEAVNAIALKR